jgi:hypothetical protein
MVHWNIFRLVELEESGQLQARNKKPCLRRAARK